MDKPIYGMAQAGRRWQRSLFPWLQSQGLEQLGADSCVFVRRQRRETPAGSRDEYLAIGVYVDDLFIAYSHDDEHSLYHEFTTSMQQRWDVDDEGEVHDLLNIEISREGADVVLRQVNYIEKLVATFLPDDFKPLPRDKTPFTKHLGQHV